MPFGTKRLHSQRAESCLFEHTRIVQNLNSKLIPIVNSVRRRLLPQHCAFCRATVEEGTICHRCLELLPVNDPFCFRCGQPVAMPLPNDVFCAYCQAAAPPFQRARAPMIYDFPVDRTLKALKFNRRLWYVPALAQLMLPLLQQEYGCCDALVPVPLHRWRHARRGFNQAVELCKPLRRATGLRILDDVVRTRPTVPQAGLDASERRKNLRDVFVVPEYLRCRHPLIVDDVITTGSTVSHLSRALLRAGADSVNALAVARVNQLGTKTGSGNVNV